MTLPRQTWVLKRCEMNIGICCVRIKHVKMYVEFCVCKLLCARASMSFG